MEIWVQYHYTHKLSLSYILTVFQLKTTWRLGNVQLLLIVPVVEVFLQEDLFHKEEDLLANSFELSIVYHFLRK